MKSIAKLAPKAKIIPMVKADAYGNGIIPISQHLVRECGIQKLGTASLGEAIILKDEVPDLGAEIMVFSDSEIQDEKIREVYYSQNITPVLHQKRDIEVFLSDKKLNHVPVVIKVNTGMNRLGVSLQDLEELAPKLKSRGIQHLLTHFACSYYPLKAGDKTNRQLEEFGKAKSLLANAGVQVLETSSANSGAIEQGIGIDETYVRPGLMMYGPYSVDENSWKGHQISRLVTKVLKTFFVKKGTPVGYGVNVAPEDGWIAVLPLGYGDGLLTYASGVEFMVQGYKAKIFARVNMDMCFLFFPPEAQNKIKAGMDIEIWNHDNKIISDMATQMKTIPYQLMCGISGRIPRIYKVK